MRHGYCITRSILIVQRVPHYPVEDGKLRASSLTRRRGGNCANTFEVLQQLVDLGGHTSDEPGVPPLRLVSVLPNKASDAVTLMANSLHGVNLDYCVHRPEAQEAASSFIIKSEATGSRTIVSYNGLPEITVEEFIEKTNQMSENVEETRGWFHFEVCSQSGSRAVTCLTFAEGSKPRRNF